MLFTFLDKNSTQFIFQDDSKPSGFDKGSSPTASNHSNSSSDLAGANNGMNSSSNSNSRGNSQAKSESPKPVRKRFGSNANELDVKEMLNGSLTGAAAASAGGGGGGDSQLSPEMELLKQEILKEMRKDLSKMKAEIIDGEGIIISLS